MVIDMHAHANYYGLTCEKLLKNMDGYGIDKAWLLTLETPPTAHFCPSCGFAP